MNIRWDDGDVEFGALNGFLSDLLRRLPLCAEAEDEAARGRLFGSPTGGKDLAADADWKEIIEPELEQLFKSHLDIVAEDLQLMREENGECSLRVSGDHLRAWVHTLNQARLALGARHEITEDDMEGKREIEDEAKGFALLQIEIYGLVLGFLLRHTDL